MADQIRGSQSANKMIRVLVLAIVVGVAQGTLWAQLPDAPSESRFARNIDSSSSFVGSPLATAAPSTGATGQLPVPSAPCGNLTASPASFVAPASGVPGVASTYAPLSRHCKFEIFVRQTYSPYTFASVAFDATWAQAFAQWPQYGGGMEGWSKRLGATLADVESRRFIQSFALASLLHEDPRYFPSGKRGLISRAWYAATRVLVTRDDYGRNVLNQSEFLGASITSSLQDLYYPRPDRTVSGTLNRFVGTLGGDASANVLREFTPDLKRLFHKHCPQKIQQFEARIPVSENLKP